MKNNKLLSTELLNEVTGGNIINGAREWAKKHKAAATAIGIGAAVGTVLAVDLTGLVVSVVGGKNAKEYSPTEMRFARALTFFGWGIPLLTIFRGNSPWDYDISNVVDGKCQKSQ